MDLPDLLSYGFGEIRDLVHAAVDGLDAESLAWRPDPEANSIGWLVWHLTRVQDDHVAEVAGHDEVWSDAWAERFGLPAGYRDLGYGHDAEQVAAVRPPDAATLTAYHDEVCDRTRAYLATLEPGDFDRVVDRRWDPPVTLGVRLWSVTGDDLQHVGQAAYLRGLLERRG